MGAKCCKNQETLLMQSKPKSPDSKDRCHVLPNDTQDESRWDSSGFYFVQAADTQFGMIDGYLKKLENPKWDEEIRLTEQLIVKCNKMQPKPLFLVVCGDLVDAMPGDPSRIPQIVDFKKVFAKLDKDIPLVCVCGNHDVGNEPTLQSLLDYKRDFGDDYFYFVKRGVLFIVINSQFYQHRANVEHYAAEQDAWLKQILTTCKNYKYTFVFEHVPWYVQEPPDGISYFNIDRATSNEWLERFHQAGVTKIMCGHHHRNGGGWYKDLEVVITSAVGAQLGQDKSGARLVHLRDDRIEHKYYNLEDLPERCDA